MEVRTLFGEGKTSMTRARYGHTGSGVCLELLNLQGHVRKATAQRDLVGDEPLTSSGDNSCTMGLYLHWLH